MEDVPAWQVPALFWIVASLAVVWQGFGCYIYLSQSLTEESARQGGYAAMAAWQWGVFAVAVWSGLIGAIALLFRSRWAQLLLLLSLVAAAVQYGYAASRGMLLPGDRPIAITILVVGVLLVWFSGLARRRAWLR